ncbi:MAG TPA: glucose-6-phosphate dehydrogenase assembly protein OpcA [Solirubrobacteraceae bacterium]|nr:glucose-6-phosphate dehydrogenase assembly protein OpcA [Solirubrobacteraceae bacterium]
MPGARSDSVWSASDTTPTEIEAAIRRLVVDRHHQNAGYVPARALNLVCVVDRDWSGEIANRLRRVGRYHASRTVVCAIDPPRTTLDAVASVASETEPKHGEFALLRETIVVTMGERHVRGLETIVRPLVVPDLTTVAWSPHDHPEALDELLGVAQSVLRDSIDDAEPREALVRSAELSQRAYVVDLAWLRTTPWRERVAAYFDPPEVRPLLRSISGVTVRHSPGSEVAALLTLGWFSSRLGWKPSPLMRTAGGQRGKATSRRQDVTVRLEEIPQAVPGMGGLTIETADGASFSLDRGPGGLHAKRRSRDGQERAWTVLGASRGEGGILGEGIRQALLRDPVYQPALRCAKAFAA